MDKKNMSTLSCKLCLHGPTICNGCKGIYCEEHYIEHRQNLGTKLERIISDHDILLDRLTTHANDNDRHRIYNDIDEWKQNNIFNKTHEKLKHTTNDIREKKTTKTYLEQDLEQWSNQIQKLKDSIELLTIKSNDD
ncbi:unnamed protein product [Didymodactylos carnosus]|uniref:B box-type domain-containing protein n=1 Tax=Didymodactylos carnosus TaxID=1234261 RepID=A0A815YBN2_9BILA|nr:unnamed protein product [Didymodactylos carnosus]CAF4430950.1 unnamed protein product [Didymodactylos carnosus]